MDTVFFSLKEVVRFSVVFSRMGGIMVFAPLFSSRSIPVQTKVILTLVGTLALLPAVPLAQMPDDLSLGIILSIGLSQMLFGMVLGLAASFLFAGMQLAGQMISFNLGFAIVNLIDPQTEVEVPVFSLLQDYLGLMFFLMLNGHHWFFLAVSDSFKYLPVTGIQLKGPLVLEVIRLSGQILVSGVQIAGPVIAVTIICDVVLGIIGRAAPQIQILIVGMPLKTLVGFTSLSISFYFLPHFLGSSFMQLFRNLFALMHGMT
jgi:flagellar biosynthetic protein FliR